MKGKAGKNKPALFVRLVLVDKEWVLYSVVAYFFVPTFYGKSLQLPRLPNSRTRIALAKDFGLCALGL